MKELAALTAFLIFYPLASQAIVKKMTCLSFPAGSGIYAVTGLLTDGAHVSETLVFDTADFSKASPKLTYTVKIHYEWSEELQSRYPQDDPITKNEQTSVVDFTVSPTHLTMDTATETERKQVAINRSTLEVSINGEIQQKSCTIENLAVEESAF